jgi:hypothetical protein
MKNLIEIKHEFDFIIFIDILSSVIIGICFNALFINWDLSIVYFAISNLILTILSYFKYSSLKNTQYTFWTLLLMNVFATLYIVFSKNSNIILFISLFSLVIQLMEVYLASSPLFYPRVNWWEYDFRYRIDIPAECTYAGETTDARISDLRRNHLCLYSFKRLKLGEEVKVVSKESDIDLLAKIITFREPNPGRGYCYGLTIEECNKSFTELNTLWKKRKKFILKSKQYE